VKESKKIESFPYTFLYFFHQIYFSLGKYFEKKFSDAKLITFSQFWVIHCLLECEVTRQNSQKAIADIMHVSEATVSKHIEKLVKLGVLKRKIDKENRRKNLLEITKKGEDIYKESRKILDHELKNIFSQVKKTSEIEVINVFKNIIKKINN
jgi:DNA-binding MarR family transcriptional regulator